MLRAPERPLPPCWGVRTLIRLLFVSFVLLFIRVSSSVVLLLPSIVVSVVVLFSSVA